MLDAADSEIKILEEKSDYKTKGYTVSELNGDVMGFQRRKFLILLWNTPTDSKMPLIILLAEKWNQ